ncbi:protein of unknown function [Taphrina deformans PYCC 5710]|uniref:Uncharacterized protein n=1 Tax=Taphrina deformans (strain PYCC 5710 / ATCC 11124 / CBS 356.35 / IMI 108563 / JCM 9778 / NBRC 8474) TaxID=1097556 RepID=R4XE47_TAPDE|nr:protein of unknown function [Taphrina deformans PYCC 5710]|eukprot:CCG81613.1 protein of unknown function [Taphrina deformans PYCC 5710]
MPGYDFSMNKADLELQVNSPPVYHGSGDIPEEEHEALLPADTDLSRGSFVFGQNTAHGTASVRRTLAGVEVYSSASLLSVGHAHDDFKCLVYKQRDFDGIKREVEGQMNHIRPNHEIAYFYTQQNEGGTKISRYLTPVSWGKLYPNLDSIGIKIRRTRRARQAKTRRILLIVFSSIALFCATVYLVFRAVQDPSATISQEIDFPKGLDVGAKGFVQCKSNQPSIVIVKGRPSD